MEYTAAQLRLSEKHIRLDGITYTDPAKDETDLRFILRTSDAMKRPALFVKSAMR